MKIIIIGAGIGGASAGIALARLGVGTDARGRPLRELRAEGGPTTNIALIDKDKGLRFLLYAT